MKFDINQKVKDVTNNCNRIVITEKNPYDPKKKKKNIVLADVQDEREIAFFLTKLNIDKASNKGNWMSPIDIYFNFMINKSFSTSIGLVLESWLRSTEWSGDYAIKNHQEFQAWLSNNKEKYIESKAFQVSNL